MIQHRFYTELTRLEVAKIYCDKILQGEYNYLIVGTFNPDDSSCRQNNGALWYYGRCENYFWYLLPKSLNSPSLHPIDNPHLSLNQLEVKWRDFCVGNKIVVIDLLKQIPQPPAQKLNDFSDENIEAAIKLAGGAHVSFNPINAFADITFRKVYFTKKTWPTGGYLSLMKRNLVNNLILSGAITQATPVMDLITPSPRKGNREEKLLKWKALIP